MGKLWSGRFGKETARVVEEFQASLPFDRRLYREDIKGSLAHVATLAKAGVLTPEEAAVLERGLREVEEDLAAGRAALDPELEDIHLAVETLLTAKVGEVGKKLHTARSRNDQVALDFRLYLLRVEREIGRALHGLAATLLDLAEANRDVLLPGLTHLQPAQPILLAHHLLAYFEMILRDLERLADCHRRTAVSPLGSGALAGVTYPLDRQAAAEALGLPAITKNSLDAVSDRDFALEFLAFAAIAMVHLSRLAEEVILWNSAPFGFVELDDAFATGSSIMPQKKNPDVAELVRGKSGRVFGDLIALLTVVKGLPLAYNKDLQEDKERVFDAVDTLLGCLAAFTPMLATLRFRADRMAEAARQGYLAATDVADYLVRQGVPFRDAHAVTGRVVRYAEEAGKSLEDLTLEEWQQFSPRFTAEVREVVKLPACLAARDVAGGTAPRRVAQALVEARTRLAAGVSWLGNE
ncbi:MAG: argininosuccinate lyase [Bacillota bacterium]|nr:argininosuccinate lyase [Bacillota bacterium]